MTTATKVFLGSAAFGAAVALIYGLVASSEPAGLTLLGTFGAASLLVAGYIWLRHRGRRRRDPEDLADADPQDGAGPLGTFPTASAWPIIFAAASTLVVAGLIYGMWLLLPAAVLFALAVVGFVRD